MTDALANDCDVLIVGGGINGCAIARDLCGRGLRVVLCEQHDLASHTSSASTKLIHGGLRYLEFGEFGLVRKALRERTRLLASVGPIAWPLRFVLPHDPTLRPLPLMRAGLWLYDHLASRGGLPPSRSIDLRRHPAGAALRPGWTRAFLYSDAWVDDSRLVVLNAMDAAERGAHVLTRTRVEHPRRVRGAWQVELRGAGGATRELRARALVNAAGPWAAGVADAAGVAHSGNLRMVKGSHIVLRRWFDIEQAYMLPNPDRRIVFVLPFGPRHVLVGTTEVAWTGDPATPRITEDETRYLCASVARFFDAQPRPQDVVWSFSGVRPLLEAPGANASALSRDYRIEFDTTDGAPLLDVWGGKITTHRLLAEEAGNVLAPCLGCAGGAWTAGQPLPGARLHVALGRARPGPHDASDFLRWLAQRLPWMPPELLQRVARAYGTRLLDWVGEARSAADLGPEVAPGVFDAELRYAAREEWAECAEDFLWRRSKCGLEMAPEHMNAVEQWFADRRFQP